MREPRWSRDSLERMKDYSELDIYYEFVDLLSTLEDTCEKAALGTKTAKKELRKVALDLKFLSDMMRQMTSYDLTGKEEHPAVLERRIKQENERIENAERRYQARIENLQKRDEEKRVENLKKAVEEQKKANEQRKKEAEQSKLQTDSENKEAQD
jgi:hypothetical protein